jgi:hypothetical protein
MPLLSRVETAELEEAADRVPIHANRDPAQASLREGRDKGRNRVDAAARDLIQDSRQPTACRVFDDNVPCPNSSIFVHATLLVPPHGAKPGPAVRPQPKWLLHWAEQGQYDGIWRGEQAWGKILTGIHRGVRMNKPRAATGACCILEGGSLYCSTTCSTRVPSLTFRCFFTVHSPADHAC